MEEAANVLALLFPSHIFKAYNDTYGHQAGDHCLQLLAKAINLAAKRPADFVARYGGEEFVVVPPNTQDGGALRVAEEIRPMSQL